MPRGGKAKKKGKVASRCEEDIQEVDGPADAEIDDENSEMNASQGKPKVWTEARESYLIQLWQEEKHLYDVEDNDYRDGELRNRALKRFAAAIGLPSAVIKTHMESMRTALLRAMKKPSGSSCLTKRDLYLLENLPWLRRQMGQKPSKSSLDTQMDTLSKSKKKAPGSSVGVTHRRQQDQDDDGEESESYAPLSDDELFSEDEEEMPTMKKPRIDPPAATSSVKKGRKTKNNEMVELMKGRNNLIHELIKEGKHKPGDDDHTGEERRGAGGISVYIKKWAEILASRVDRMPKQRADRFMHSVDGQALDVLEEL